MRTVYQFVLSAIAATFILASVALGQTVIVYSNNPAPGDDFTNSGGSFANLPVGSSGWAYRNVRYDGHVGIRTDLPRSGNGSVWFKGVLGPSGDSSKADIEYWNKAGFGTLANLSSLSYEWYRKLGSYTANSWLHPVLRIYITNDDGTSRGYLVFERAYNQGTVPVPTDEWIFDDVVANDYKVWATGTLPDPFRVYDRKLSDWQALLPDYKVVAISSGIGSGWGTFEGAVDNISWGFGGGLKTANFEVVPEPGTMALFGLGLAAVGGFVRRKRA